MNTHNHEVKHDLKPETGVATHALHGNCLSQFSIEELGRLFVYNNGFLYRRQRDGSVDFSKPAGSKSLTGYIVVSIRNKRYLAHRVIWRMHNREMPETVDHINGNRADNRLENLRAATKAENLRNTGIRPVNKSGTKGVSWHKDARKWRGSVNVNGKQYHAGLYEDKTECIRAVEQLRKELHGEFARNA